MNLLPILRKLWDYKLVTLPIVAIVLAGSFYVIAVQAPTYESSATYMLIPPPSPPVGEPATDTRTNNPYSRLSDPSVLVQVLASQLNSKEFRRGLADQGVDSKYEAQPSAQFGFSAPIMQISATGTSAEQAVETATVVGQALTRTLANMQKLRGVDENYWITTEAVVPAADATLKPSGKLRSLVAILILGTILLFMAISILDVVGVLRRERAQARSAEESQASGRAPQLVSDPGPEDGAPEGASRSNGGWERTRPALDPEILP